MTLEIIKTKNEYFRKIKSLLKKNSSIKIATYNIYTGVLDDGRYTNDWGGKFFNSVGALFDLMTLKSCNVHIKVGMPRKFSCPLAGLNVFDDEGEEVEEECANESKNRKWDGRWEHTQKRWNRFKFEEIGSSHVKLVLIAPNHCLFGGRNLSNSSDQDLSFYTADDELYKKLLKEFNELQ